MKNMLRFEHAEAFTAWAIFALVFSLVFVFFLLWQQKRLKALVSSKLLKSVVINRSVAKHWTKYILILFGSFSLATAIANLQSGAQYEKVVRKGVNLMIALDVSKSMLADDVKPNRMLRAKQFVSRFIDQLANDKLGLIVFAGNAYLQMPLTVDYTAGRMYLKNVNTRMIPTQGTAIGDAISLALEGFQEQETESKVLMIITDGENHEGEALNMAKEAKEEGLIIYTVGVGTPKGSPIPEKNNFKRDKEGNIVLSRLNEEMLSQIANITDGGYYRMSNNYSEIGDILADIGKLEGEEFGEFVYTDYKNQFQWFLLIALVFLTLDFLFSHRKNVLLRRWLGE